MLLTLPCVPLCPFVAAAAAFDAIEGPNTACQEGCPSTAPALPCSAQEHICDGGQDSWALWSSPKELPQARCGASSRWLVQGPPVPLQAPSNLNEQQQIQMQNESTLMHNKKTMPASPLSQ